jgi:hypothetical protein
LLRSLWLPNGNDVPTNEAWHGSKLLLPLATLRRIVNPLTIWRGLKVQRLIGIPLVLRSFGLNYPG